MKANYRWKSLVDDSHIDTAQVTILATGVRAEGTQQTSGYQARWALDAPSDWVTASLHVQVRGLEGWSRTLDLSREATTGLWTARTGMSGRQPQGLARPGLAAAAQLDGALDCDLGACPMTNLMPIRRLGLLESHIAEQSLLMAWVEMPSLAVRPSVQRYASLDRHHVRYLNGTGEIDVELEVDHHGMVTRYPGLAELAPQPEGHATRRT